MIDLNDLRLEIETLEPRNMLDYTIAAPGATGTVTGWSATNGALSYAAATNNWTLTGTAIVFTANGGGTGILRNTTSVAAQPGEWVGASIMCAVGGFVRVGIEFLNSGGAVIQTSNPTTAPPTPAQPGIRVEWKAQAPANTATARLIVWMANSFTATGNVFNFSTATNGTVWQFDQAVLIVQKTQAMLDDLTYATTNDTPNYILNPSGTGGTFGWTETDPDNGYLHNAIDMNDPYINEYQWASPSDYTGPALYLTLDYGSTLTPGVFSNTKTVNAGQYVGGSVRVFGANNRAVRAGWTWINAAGAVISTTWTAWTTVNSNTGQMGGVSRFIKIPTTVAPANTNRVRMELEWAKDSTPATGEELSWYDWFSWWDAGLMIGSTVGEVDSAWPAAFPIKYRNLLSPVSEISLKSGQAEVGILSARIHDAAFDPAYDPTMKVGATVRLRAKVDGIWENRFVGKVQRLNTTYNKDGSTEIALTAVDGIADLVRQRRTQGVATIPEAAALLAGVDIPWQVNGSPVYSGTPAYTYTAEGSLLDHMLITRDTQKGYFWVDRDGTLQVYDTLKMPYVDPRVMFTDQVSPAPAAIQRNLMENPKSNSAGRIPTSYALSSVSNNTRGLVVSSTATTYTTEPIGVVWAPDASKYITTARTEQWSVRMRIKATKACRVEFGHFSYTNTFNTLQPFADLTAGQSIELSGTFTASQWSASQPFFKPMLRVTDSGSSTTITGGQGELLAVEWIIMQPGANTSITYFDGDSRYAYWTAKPQDSVSVFDVGGWASYTHIDSGWASDDVVNAVSVKVLSGTTTTENGPYVNQTSIDNWGASGISATITTGPTATAWATGILNGNANPIVTPGALTFAVRDAGTFKKAATIDLYDNVIVEYKNMIVGNFRISSLEHKISPGKWTVTMTFNKRISSTLW